MFGELIGLWAASVVARRWAQPENVRLVELGPGRGTLMADALRAAQVVPAFRAAVVVHLVEISPALQERQQQALATLDVPVMWHQSLRRGAGRPRHRPRQRILRRAAGQPGGQAVDGWHERVVEIDADGNLAFGIANDLIPLFEQLRAARDARRADRRDLRMARRQPAARCSAAASRSRAAPRW